MCLNCVCVGRNGDAHLANFNEKRHQWVSMYQEGDERYTDTLCAETHEVSGSSACEVGATANVSCRFKVTSTLHDVSAYRISFNTANPGYFTSTTLKEACTELSDAIYNATGSNPRLKPICNHMSTGTGFCDYDTARFYGSYLTQCDSTANRATKCAGFPFEAVTCMPMQGLEPDHLLVACFPDSTLVREWAWQMVSISTL